MFGSLAVPQYRRYMLGFIASAFGFQSNLVVLGWLAFELSDSTLILGTVLFTSGIAQAVASPIGGVLADRIDRRRQIVAAQAFTLATVIVMGVIVATGVLELWHLFVSAGAFGFAMSIHMPARQAFVYNIVGGEHIANAMVLNSGTMSAMRLIGPGIAGILIGTTGADTVYFLGAAGYAISIWSLIVLMGPVRQDIAQATEPVWETFRGGVAYMWRNPIMLWLVLALLGATTIALPFRDLMPAFAVDALDQGPEGFGLLLSMVGLGALLGSLGLAAFVAVARKGRLLIALGVAWGIALTALAAAPNVGVAILILMVLGAASTGFNTLSNILVHTYVDDAYRGRMMSFHMLTFATHPMGALALGALAEGIGIRWTYAASGLVMVLFAAALGLYRKDLRRLT